GLTVLGYLWIARRFPARRRQWACFWTGVLALAAALVSPLDAGADLLFTLHMAQHMLLLLVAPPLLALAVPPALIGRLYRQPRLAGLLHRMWSPVASLVLFNGSFSSGTCRLPTTPRCGPLGSMPWSTRAS